MMRFFVISVCFGLNAFGVSPQPSKSGMAAGYWSSGIKEIFGTSYESYDEKLEYSRQSRTSPVSKVWFTGAQGVLTEVFWPSVDEAQVRDHQVLVSDGKNFFQEERNSVLTEVQWIEAGVPAFHLVNRDPKGRFVIHKWILTDPDRDVVLERITIERSINGLSFYLLHNPSVSNSPLGDHAFASVGEAPGPGLYAFQGNEAQAVVSTLPFLTATAGYEGTPSDGFQDLKADNILNSRFPKAENGNVVLTGQLDVPSSRGTTTFEIAIGFGKNITEAHEIAWSSLNSSFDRHLEKYRTQWRDYQKTVRDLTGSAGDGGKLFRASVATLKSMEDKTRAGAFVAAPSIPWGLHQSDWNGGQFSKDPRQSLVSGYHIVWPRDLYQMASAFLSIDDAKSAIASLNYLQRIQYGPNSGMWSFGKHERSKQGSFPQNCWVDGTPHWGGLQMDEVGMPVILAHRLWKLSAIRLTDYWEMVRNAADFIVEFGPWSPQERWEEIYGVTPSTLSAELAALRSASEMARHMEDNDRAGRYQKAFEDWNQKLETWLFTSTGGLGNGKYFTRVEGGSTYDQVWDPNDNATFTIANGAGTYREKDVIDGGFLELVRFGVRKALSYHIEESLAEYDSSIGVDIPGIGRGFRRYLHDRYHYDEGANGAQTLAMPWPLLTGERGHYELARGIEKGLSPFELDGIVNPYLLTMEAMATKSLFLPEQVKDSGPDAGKSQGSATPLGWSHAEYLKLLRSRTDRRVFDHYVSE